MSNALSRLFLNSSLRNVAVAIVNLASTVLIVRWFGAAAYANFIVDLSTISILLIILEAIPSNYSLFRIQDDPQWQQSIAAQTSITILMAALIVSLIGTYSNQIQDFSPWMALYAGSFAIKRYLDIRLQSSGRLHEYMNIEVITSCLRLIAMAICFIYNITAVSAIWASLAIANLASQMFWLLKNPHELQAFTHCFDKETLKTLTANFSAYRPYYLGIALKRLKDNLAPIAAERVFNSHEMLAAFLLAYRGIIFASGQMRIVEALLNHRASLLQIGNITRHKQLLVTFAGQIICIIASAMILLTSGVNDLPWLATLTLSFMIWPITYSMIERSKAYSSFKASIVNWSMVGYIFIVAFGCLILKSINLANIVLFSMILVIAEIASFSTFFLFWKKKHVRND